VHLQVAARHEAVGGVRLRQREERPPDRRRLGSLYVVVDPRRDVPLEERTDAGQLGQRPVLRTQRRRLDRPRERAPRRPAKRARGMTRRPLGLEREELG
jgi:hypothetical protein